MFLLSYENVITKCTLNIQKVQFFHPKFWEQSMFTGTYIYLVW